MKKRKIFPLILLILAIAFIVTTMILGASSISRSDETIARIDRKINNNY